MSNVLCKTNQEIPQEMLLGNLLFTNLIDMKIPVTDLVNIFTTNNIPESYVRTISEADAFRRASSSIKNRTLYVTNCNGGSDKVRVEVDEVKCDTDGIKRIIGIKRVDEVNEDIQYEPVGEIIYNRANNACVATPTCPAISINYQAIRDLCDEVEDKYKEWPVYHNKDTVRNIVNRIITDTHPVNLMPTGLCKFIPQDSTDLLYNLKHALSEMSSYRINNTTSENTMEIIPVIDTEEQRSLIEKNFTAEITNELFDFTQELKEVLTKKTSLSVRTANSYIEKFNILKEKAKEYESLLDIYVDSLYQQITESLDLINSNTEID
jgi:hypothetical protein